MPASRGPALVVTHLPDALLVAPPFPWPRRPGPRLGQLIPRRTTPANHLHELGARALVVPKGAQHAGGHGQAARLLDPAHLHAEMPGLDHDANSERADDLLQALGDLAGQPLLELQAAGVDLD